MTRSQPALLRDLRHINQSALLDDATQLATTRTRRLSKAVSVDDFIPQVRASPRGRPRKTSLRESDHTSAYESAFGGLRASKRRKLSPPDDMRLTRAASKDLDLKSSPVSIKQSPSKSSTSASDSSVVCPDVSHRSSPVQVVKHSPRDLPADDSEEKVLSEVDQDAVNSGSQSASLFPIVKVKVQDVEMEDAAVIAEDDDDDDDDDDGADDDDMEEIGDDEAVEAEDAENFMIGSPRANERPSPTTQADDDSDIASSNLPAAQSGKVVKRLPGRRRAPHAIPRIEAAIRRQLHLRMRFRVVVKGLKPILTELAKRSINELDSDPQAHLTNPAHSPVQAQLDHRLAKRNELLASAFALDEKRLQEAYDTNVEYVTKQYNSRADDLQDEAILDLQHDLLSVLRKHYKEQDDAASDDEGDGVVAPLRQKVRSRFTGIVLGHEYESRSRPAIEIQRLFDSQRFNSAILDEQHGFDETSIQAPAPKFAILDPTQRIYGTTKRRLDLLIKAGKSLDHQQMTEVIPNDMARKLQLLADLSASQTPSPNRVKLPRLDDMYRIADAAQISTVGLPPSERQDGSNPLASPLELHSTSSRSPLPAQSGSRSSGMGSMPRRGTFSSSYAPRKPSFSAHGGRRPSVSDGLYNGESRRVNSQHGPFDEPRRRMSQTASNRPGFSVQSEAEPGHRQYMQNNNSVAPASRPHESGSQHQTSSYAKTGHSRVGSHEFHARRHPSHSHPQSEWAAITRPMPSASRPETTLGSPFSGH